jgi:hypothetical protein
MKRWIGAGIVAAALVFGGSVTTCPAAAAPRVKMQASGTSGSIDISARRHHRRYARDYAYHYYGRPIYYRPYPYQAPAPFTFGIGFGPSWW